MTTTKQATKLEGLIEELSLQMPLKLRPEFRRLVRIVELQNELLTDLAKRVPDCVCDVWAMETLADVEAIASGTDHATK